MLRTLYIKNFILIKDLLLEFKPGFSVFTGETGAGKSIFLDALALTLGARSEINFICKDSSQSTIIAAFSIEKNTVAFRFLEAENILIEENELLFLKRTIRKDGISRAFINDQPVTLTFLKSLAKHLVEIHGQFDRLLEPKTHRHFLDTYASLCNEAKHVEESYTAWQYLESKKYQLSNTVNKENRTLLKHYLKEIEYINPEPNEEKILLEKRDRLFYAEKITESVQKALTYLEESPHGAESTLTKSIIACETARNYNERFNSCLDNLSSSLVQIQEAAREFNRFLQEDKDDSNELDMIENRLAVLKDLSRKHNCKLENLTQVHQKLLGDFKALDNKEEYLKRSEDDCQKAKTAYEKMANNLSKLRLAAIKNLEKEIMSELPSLKMDRALFRVHHKYLEEATWGPLGIDRIVFEIAPNGTVFAPLKKIASGGERARFMLALKVVLTTKNTKTSIVFDEIDSGVGGAVATAIGARLYKLSQIVQVICISHAPQVAAWAINHYKVNKNSDTSEVIYTNIEQLDKVESEEEIARMLSGEHITNQARAAAQILKKSYGK